jgi:hypothetical protein
MSHTSDPRSDSLLERAAAAGMMPPELRGWREALDPLSLDSCGCESSARAAAVVGVIAGLGALGAPRRNRAASWWAAATLTAAIVGKVLGQRTAERRSERLLGILEERVRELASPKA